VCNNLFGKFLYLLLMAPGSTRPHKASARKRSGSKRWLIAVAGVLAIAAGGLLTASFVAPHDREAQAMPAGMCPHLEVDEKTGQVRDKGFMPCDRIQVQNGRIDSIRESFKSH
jgi:hypothetical protein